MKIRLTDKNKRSLVKRIIELEKRGWECIMPIKTLDFARSKNIPHYYDKIKKGKVETSHIVKYITFMKKVIL